MTEIVLIEIFRSLAVTCIILYIFSSKIVKVYLSKNKEDDYTYKNKLSNELQSIAIKVFLISALAMLAI